MLACLMLSAGCRSRPAQSRPAAVREVRVAAAADLKFALDELVAEFQRRNADMAVKPTYGSSGNFRAQLLNKAPFDIYLSADISYPQELIDRGIAGRDSLFTYAVGRIVIWAPKGSAIDVKVRGPDALTDPSVRKIAIANPEHAPYGRAAEAALRHLGLYDRVKDRLVLGENIAQAAQFVESGGADVGVLALSLAMAPRMQIQGEYWEIPLAAYPRMDQGGVVLPWAVDREAAVRFRDFLLGEEGQAILERYGFFRPGR